MSHRNHPYNIEYIFQLLTAELCPQPGHDKPRHLWNSEERSDGRPKTNTIKVLFVKPNELPELLTIENELSAMQELIGGLLTTFDPGIEGCDGWANDEAVLLQMAPNRFIESTGSLILGPFFIASSGTNPHSLSADELELALRAFVPPLTLEQVQRALRGNRDALDDIEEGPASEGETAIERELDDALGE